MPLKCSAIKKGAPCVGPLILTAALLVCTAGCHSSDVTPASVPPSPQAQAQSQAASVGAVQSNQNIPPQAKAGIVAQMQGKGPQTGQPSHP